MSLDLDLSALGIRAPTTTRAGAISQHGRTVELAAEVARDHRQRAVDAMGGRPGAAR